jgi:translation initiation factor 1
MSQDKNSRLVYSTDKGKITPSAPAPTAPKGDGVLRVFRETKGRGGKCVCVIKGLEADKTALTALLKNLKQLCGTGGTLKDFDIEIQGDHRDKIKAYLEQQGHKVKLAGG